MDKKRSGTEFITAIPKESGRAVSMLNYKDHILLACEYHIYELSNDDKVFRKIKFEEVKDVRKG